MISQIFIVIFGSSAVWLVGRKNINYRIFGFICGLISQPFWFYTTISHKQWGLVILCTWYTYSWFSGLRNALQLKKSTVIF